MIRASDDYWDSDRASYEDELGAWRERTTVAVAIETRGHPIRCPPIDPAALPGPPGLGSGQTCARGTLRGGSAPAREAFTAAGHAQAARRERADTRRTGVRPPLTFWPCNLARKIARGSVRAGSLSQPVHRSAVRRERGPKHRPRAPEPVAGSSDLPATMIQIETLGSAPPRAIQPRSIAISTASRRFRSSRADELIDVGDVRLQLDDEEHSRARVPGEDVDDSALAIDRKRDFGLGDPVGKSAERPRDQFV